MKRSLLVGIEADFANSAIGRKERNEEEVALANYDPRFDDQSYTLDRPLGVLERRDERALREDPENAHVDPNSR